MDFINGETVVESERFSEGGKFHDLSNSGSTFTNTYLLMTLTKYLRQKHAGSLTQCIPQT